MLDVTLCVSPSPPLSADPLAPTPPAPTAKMPGALEALSQQSKLTPPGKTTAPPLPQPQPPSRLPQRRPTPGYAPFPSPRAGHLAWLHFLHSEGLQWPQRFSAEISEQA